MNKEILLIAQMVANEKSVDAFVAIESALALVTASKLEKGVEVRVSINRRTGGFETFRCWTIVPDNIDLTDVPDELAVNYIKESQAILDNPVLKVGDKFEKQIPSIEFSRIDAQNAKQIFTKRIREAERDKVIEVYRTHIGEILTGTVRRINREGIILDVGDDVEAFLPREEMIPKEEIRAYDRLRVYLYEVAPQARGPQLLVSRTSPQMLIALFKLKVLEVEAGVIEIKRMARDPGIRAKVAVKTNDGRIDPIGMCIGMRGERVQAISNEINGEHIDIILWDENPAQLAINAIAPAEVTAITMDEETHTMDVAVQEVHLSRAIGRSGQNVRLASELTGWTLNIMTVEAANEKSVSKAEEIEAFFKTKLAVDEELAKVLVREGFTTLEEIAYLSTEELTSISGIDPVQLEMLRSQTRDVLLEQALISEGDWEQPMQHDQQQLLDTLPGVNAELLSDLTAQKITTRDALAELAVDDLLDITSLDRKQAGELIMAARAHWVKAP